jgi:hypothetical protein
MLELRTADASEYRFIAVVLCAVPFVANSFWLTNVTNIVIATDSDAEEVKTPQTVVH